MINVSHLNATNMQLAVNNLEFFEDLKQIYIYQNFNLFILVSNNLQRDEKTTETDLKGVCFEEIQSTYCLYPQTALEFFN